MTRIDTVDQLAALPAETLLRSEQPGYGPTYLLTYDAGDDEVMFTTAGGDHPGFLTAEQAITEHGPLVLVHQGSPTPEPEGTDPWANPYRQEAAG